MAELSFIKMNEIESLRLRVLRLVMSDTAAAKVALDFIGGDELKAELFADAYKKVQTESEAVARALKAVDDAGTLLKVFG